MMQILVHERTSFFTAELQRHFHDVAEVQVCWVPHAADLKASAGNAHVILLHLDQEACLKLMQTLSAHSQGKFLVMMTHSCPEKEWALRELGADAVLLDTVQRSRLHDVVERMLA